MGVRNKYCSVCAVAENQGKPPQDHDCYKNWDGPSSSMETDITLEGFKISESKYGLRYTKFDGDTSVHPTLITEVPRGVAIIKATEATASVEYVAVVGVAAHFA